MDIHQEFTEWVKREGGMINGVEPARLSGKGIGMVATQELKTGEEIVDIPTKLLLRASSIPSKFRQKLNEISVHGLLAAYLCLAPRRELDDLQVWIKTWPSKEDFADCMPLILSDQLKDLTKPKADGSIESLTLLPLAILGPRSVGECKSLRSHSFRPHLQKQEDTLLTSWKIVSKAFPAAGFKQYRYFWLIVNSRSFYYDVPQKPEPLHHADKMVLCPYLDYFNHADEGIRVQYNEDGFSVTTDRTYAKGEEIHFCYGSHNNDFLWTEYGFVLDDNKWDSLNLDPFMFADGTGIGKEAIQNRLRSRDFLGGYTLAQDGACWRTQVATRTQTLESRDWQKFASGLLISMSGEEDQRDADSFLATHVLLPYFREAVQAEKYLLNLDVCMRKLPETFRGLALKRWRQIKSLLRTAAQNSFIEPVKSKLLNDFDSLESSSD